MQIIGDKTVKIRKPHRCFGCRRPFPVGTTMRKTDTEDGGSISTCYHCAVCSEIQSLTDFYDDWLDEGWVLDDIDQSRSKNEPRMTIENYLQELRRLHAERMQRVDAVMAKQEAHDADK